MAQDVLLQILANQRVGGVAAYYVLEHGGRHVHRDAAQLADPRVDGAPGQIRLIHALRQGEGGCGEDLRAYLAKLADDGGQPDTGEDEDVVALPDSERLALMVHVLERAAGGDQHAGGARHGVDAVDANGNTLRGDGSVDDNGVDAVDANGNKLRGDGSVDDSLLPPPSQP